MAVRAQVDQTKHQKSNFECWNPPQMYMLIQLFKEQLSLVVTQCLFHALTTSDHAQLRPEDAIMLQVCVALAMWHHGIFVHKISHSPSQYQHS